MVSHNARSSSITKRCIAFLLFNLPSIAYSIPETHKVCAKFSFLTEILAPARYDIGRNEKGDDKAVVTIKCVKSCNCDIYYYGTSLTKTENKKLAAGDSVTISLKNTSTYGVIVVDAYQ